MSSNKTGCTDSISTSWLLENLRPKDKIDLTSLPIATLAYLGDAIHNLFVKVKFLNDLSVGQIHRKVVHLISRESQARCLERLLPRLSEREFSVVKRALNSKCAKRYGNDEKYRKSTALEALIGYLYLAGEQARMLEILTFTLVDEESDDRVR